MAKGFFSILGLATLALAAHAATICSVLREAPEDRLGKKELAKEEASRKIAELSPKELLPFADAGGGGVERLSAYATMEAGGYAVVVVASGRGRVETQDDIGGEIVMQIRRNMQNTDGDKAPTIFSYYCGRQERPPEMLYGAFYGKTDSRLARDPKSRLSRLVPGELAAGALEQLPKVSFRSLPDGWALVFSFSWVPFFDELLIKEGSSKASSSPVSWRLCIRRVRDDGTIATLGTPDDPVALAWPRGFKADSLRRAVIGDDVFRYRYSDLAYAYDCLYSAYKQERHIKSFDVGRETFEQKNGASDEVFYKNYFEPYRESNMELVKAVEADRRDTTQKPAVFSMPKATFDEVYSQLGRLYYARRNIEALRRDYLLARFAGEKDPRYASPALEAARAKKEKAAAQEKPSSAPSMDMDEGSRGDALIDLDDITF